MFLPSGLVLESILYRGVQGEISVSTFWSSLGKYTLSRSTGSD